MNCLRVCIILEATVTHLLLEERASDKGKSIATRRSWVIGQQMKCVILIGFIRITTGLDCTAPNSNEDTSEPCAKLREAQQPVIIMIMYTYRRSITLKGHLSIRINVEVHHRRQSLLSYLSRFCRSFSLYLRERALKFLYFTLA